MTRRACGSLSGALASAARCYIQPISVLRLWISEGLTQAET